MFYELAQLSSTLSLPDGFFLLREKGEAAYNILIDVIDQVPEHEPLVLVFPENQIIDASFADEALVRLYETLMTGKHGERTMLFMGLTEDSRTNIDAAIHLRNLKMAILIVQADGSWQVVGQLERSLRETLEIVAEQGSMTAPTLAEMIGSAVNTASNRLKRLYDGRLIRREHEFSEKGLQYIYHFWNWNR